MRTPLGVTCAVLLAACAGGGARQTVQLTGPATGSSTQTMECVNRQLQSMNYQVAATGQQTGSITATRRNEQPWWLRMVGYRDTADQLTISTEQGQLRVSALSSDPGDPAGGGGGRDATGGTAASAGAQQDARRIINACAGSR